MYLNKGESDQILQSFLFICLFVVVFKLLFIIPIGLLEENVTKILKPPAHKIINASTAGKIKEMKNKPPRSPSPTKSNESSIAINQLNQELQQLMIEGKQDKGAQRVSPTKKISPLSQQTGHEGTPYNRAGTRKFVSKAERRRSSEGLPEEVSYLLPDYADSLYERMAPSPHAPVEPSNKRPTVETIAESQTVSSVSYSAVLKGVSQETTKPGAAKTKESQSKTFSRPPPGFPPLPTHGGDTKMHMTVLGNKSKTKTPGPSNSTPRNNTPTRADASMNWRNDGRQEPRNQTSIQPVNPSPSGQGVKWRSYDDTVSQTESKAPPMSGASSDASSQRGETPQEDQASVKSDESNEPPPIVQPHRVFGPGGLKACVICGSKEHLRCNDRSKMFMD